MLHYFYFARCSDGSLYAGYTNNIAKREAAHNAKKGAKYTAGRTPIHIIYTESFEIKGAALRREAAVKKWTKQKKEYLIVQAHLQKTETERNT